MVNVKFSCVGLPQDDQRLELGGMWTLPTVPRVDEEVTLKSLTAPTGAGVTSLFVRRVEYVLDERGLQYAYVVLGARRR